MPVHLVVEEDHAAVRLAHRGGRRQVEARHRAREDGRRAEEAQQQGELALLAVEGVDPDQRMQSPSTTMKTRITGVFLEAAKAVNIKRKEQRSRRFT